MEHIRNFAIIAHIDHGKSTLSDRLIEKCSEYKNNQSQMLDDMDIERERGITIKAQTVKLQYTFKSKKYQLNLIDTPGHVDFTYEVSRSLDACEGSILLVDGCKGVEAQTISNAEKAIQCNHVILPVINKADVPHCDVEKTLKQLSSLLKIDVSVYFTISAKSGWGIDELLEGIVKHLPSPKKSNQKECKALWIDSWYNSYLGVTALLRVFNGSIRKNDILKMMHKKKIFSVNSVGVFSPLKKEVDVLQEGEIGYIVTKNKNLDGSYVGESIIHKDSEDKIPLSAFKPRNPVVFCSFYPAVSSDLHKLDSALKKLHLNDCSFTFFTEKSNVLGCGFKCGFLGLLHMEIISERLKREFEVEVISTFPSVSYKYLDSKNNLLTYKNINEIPEEKLKDALEPFVHGCIFTPCEYVGKIIELCEKKRGIQSGIEYINEKVKISYKLPLLEILIDFYDSLKSCSEGYATFNYSKEEYIHSNLSKLDILLNGEKVDILSQIVHKECADKIGRRLCEKLKELIPRQLFVLAIQAVCGKKIIARENISAFRKDVTAKCYGGDKTRQKKLLEKQKEGKKRMRSIGKVNIPNSVFSNLIKIK